MSIEPIDYRYGAHASQFVRLYLPQVRAAAGVVVVIHGGFWRFRYGIEYADPLCRNLSQAGYAAVGIEYRRVDPREGSSAGGGWPTTGEDVAMALDSLATTGQIRSGGRLDLDRVVAVGHSAGGHLAAWLAHRSANAVDPAVRLRGAVCQAPVLDLVAAATGGVGGRAVIDLLGGPPAEVPDRYADASPTAQIGSGARLALVHGTADDQVPVAQSRDYLAAATAAGDPVSLTELPGVGHFELIDPLHDAWAQCRLLATDLLAR